MLVSLKASLVVVRDGGDWTIEVGLLVGGCLLGLKMHLLLLLLLLLQGWRGSEGWS